jgi:hypothetical protein
LRSSLTIDEDQAQISIGVKVPGRQGAPLAGVGLI